MEILFRLIIILGIANAQFSFTSDSGVSPYAAGTPISPAKT